MDDRIDWIIARCRLVGDRQRTLSPDYWFYPVRVRIKFDYEDDAPFVLRWLEDNVGRVTSWSIVVEENDHDCPSCMCEDEVVGTAEVVVLCKEDEAVEQFVYGIRTPSHRRELVDNSAA